MKFNLHRPCADCPFRKDVAFYLRDARRLEIAESLSHDGTFVCHKTTDGDWSDEGEYTPTGNEVHCAGALLVMVKGDELRNNYMMRLAIFYGWLDPEKLDTSAPVFDSLDGFIKGEPNHANT